MPDVSIDMSFGGFNRAPPDYIANLSGWVWHRSHVWDTHADLMPYKPPLLSHWEKTQVYRMVHGVPSKWDWLSLTDLL